MGEILVVVRVFAVPCVRVARHELAIRDARLLPVLQSQLVPQEHLPDDRLARARGEGNDPNHLDVLALWECACE